MRRPFLSLRPLGGFHQSTIRVPFQGVLSLEAVPFRLWQALGGQNDDLRRCCSSSSHRVSRYTFSSSHMCSHAQPLPHVSELDLFQLQLLQMWLTSFQLAPEFRLQTVTAITNEEITEFQYSIL